MLIVWTTCIYTVLLLSSCEFTSCNLSGKTCAEMFVVLLSPEINSSLHPLKACARVHVMFLFESERPVVYIYIKRKLRFGPVHQIYIDIIYWYSLLNVEEAGFRALDFGQKPQRRFRFASFGFGSESLQTTVGSYLPFSLIVLKLCCSRPPISHISCPPHLRTLVQRRIEMLNY